MSIEVNQLSKSYGAQKALDEVTFQAKPGQILGFLGPNGAGKSTTMKIATGYLAADSGDVLIKGVSVGKHPKVVSRMLGYLPEHNPLYPDMYISEFLHFVGSLYAIDKKKIEVRIRHVMERCGLMPEKSKRIGQLSKGYRQRVGLAKALIHDPEIIILDEPTTGLDPNQLVEIRGLIREISEQKTLIISTHIMQEVEAICEKVVIIHRGKVVAQDLLQNLTVSGQSDGLILETEEPLELGWFERFPVRTIRELAPNRFLLLSSEPIPVLRKQVMTLLAEKNLSLVEMKHQSKNLEAIFHQLTQSR
ncbi:ABC transporter, ATP-binding protein [Lunatimonas lonarensis]|uniref:ABC transporter, ATP-binding protein n=1 Tax=Lunatimonas lonarensis TaxID=1232681 RepID=R7ZQF7_9BACT|nr:gliding motility-associated ABC transporter ATP-binding subunit GldA [Lunatimonas lonarensis]EON76317.1 ABC transporter, ATP-binding protein [Lunatimonas lonarensis]